MTFVALLGGLTLFAAALAVGAFGRLLIGDGIVRWRSSMAALTAALAFLAGCGITFAVLKSAWAGHRVVIQFLAILVASAGLLIGFLFVSAGYRHRQQRRSSNVR